jgi:ABC-type polysaccharide/polyol phosphate export permease
MHTATSIEDSAPLGAELTAQPSRAQQAVIDLCEGFAKSWLWTALAMQDIKLRYRGSLLGPLWLTVSTVVMIATMGLLYPKLFHTEVSKYLPFLSVGLILWGFVSTLITDGCTTFVAVAGIIQQVRLPYSLHVYRLVYRNIVVLAHSVVILPVVLLIFRTPIGWDVIMVVPAAILLAVNGVWIAFLLGMLSARFRDVPPIVGSFLQVVFFLTPIFWSPDLLGKWKTLAELNPLFVAVDVMRAPLLGTAPGTYSWLVLCVMTVIGCTVAFVVFARFRSRIAFWV